MFPDISLVSRIIFFFTFHSAKIIQLQQSISLNDEVILSEQSTDTDVAKITNGRHLHSVVKDAIANDGGYVGSNESNNPGIELMDDDEAEEARKYFGVF